MFSNNDFYNLDDASKTLRNLKMMVDINIKLETLTQLLIKHGVTNDLEVEACENYIKTLPHIKAMLNEMQQTEATINNYKANPQQHLRDIMTAKMNGQIR